MKPLGLAPLAIADLRSIADYIAEDNPERAVTFCSEIAEKALKAAEQPKAYTERPDLDAGLRAMHHGRYLILFRELGAEVRIVRILHSSRDLTQLFK